MLKKNVIFLIIIVTLPSCNGRMKNVMTIPFEHGKYFINRDSISNDSLLQFFPPELITDTAQPSIDLLKLKTRSYMLQKMKEPILYDHYLEREIYRLIVLRAFNIPLVIRIEKFPDSITMIIKKLDRSIMFPFIVYGKVDSIGYTTAYTTAYTPPPSADTDSTQRESYMLENKDREPYSVFKKRNDSIAKIYNNPNYYLVLDLSRKFPLSIWDSLQNKVVSTRFWKTKPDVALNYLQIDGSNWILEGHNKHGYQIKIIPSPNFKDSDYENKFDPQNSYARLFYYIIRLSNVDNEKLY